MKSSILNDLLASSSSLSQSLRQARQQDVDIRAQAQRRAAAKGLDATVNVKLSYSIGADGQYYASGATVTSTRRTEGTAQEPIQRPTNLTQKQARARTLSELQPPNISLDSSSFASLLEDRQTSDFLAKQQLIIADAGVRSHERQHVFAAGGLAGAPVYDLEEGPDGEFYAVGGEVRVSAGNGGSPEKRSRDAATLALAATGPADGSSADLGAAGGFLRGATQVYDRSSRLVRDIQAPQFSLAA